jgi:hypothetical protein
MTADDLHGVVGELGKRKREDGGAHETPGYVYAAYSHGNGTKIGMTCQMNPLRRIRQLNIAIRHRTTLSTSSCVETRVH